LVPSPRRFDGFQNGCRIKWPYKGTALLQAGGTRVRLQRFKASFPAGAIFCKTLPIRFRSTEWDDLNCRCSQEDHDGRNSRILCTPRLDPWATQLAAPGVCSTAGCQKKDRARCGRGRASTSFMSGRAECFYIGLLRPPRNTFDNGNRVPKKYSAKERDRRRKQLDKVRKLRWKKKKP